MAEQENKPLSFDLHRFPILKVDIVSSKGTHEHDSNENKISSPVFYRSEIKTPSYLSDGSLDNVIVKQRWMKPHVQVGFHRRENILNSNNMIHAPEEINETTRSAGVRSVVKVTKVPKSLRLSLSALPNLLTLTKEAKYAATKTESADSIVNSHAEKTEHDCSSIDQSLRARCWRWMSCSFSCTAISLLLVIIIFACLGGLLGGLLIRKNTSLTKANNRSSSATATTTALTVGSSITAPVTCAPGYSLSPSNVCVNLLIDFYNCGFFGHVCSANYTSCSGGTCSMAPAVHLTNGAGTFSSSFNTDDAFVSVNLPLNVTLFNYSTSTVSVSSNGVLCLGGCSWDYTNGNLPSSSFSGVTAFGYWDDLYLSVGTSQNIYYAVNGLAPNRTVVFEFYTTHYGQTNQYYHFQILFYEGLPNIVQYIYFEASDTGVSATIGVQKSGTGPSMTYSVNQANSVTPNMVLIFNTDSGTYTG